MTKVQIKKATKIAEALIAQSRKDGEHVFAKYDAALCEVLRSRMVLKRFARFVSGEIMATFFVGDDWSVMVDVAAVAS